MPAVKCCTFLMLLSTVTVPGAITAPAIFVVAAQPPNTATSAITTVAPAMTWRRVEPSIRDGAGGAALVTLPLRESPLRDKLTSGTGSDYLSGGSGNDTFVFGPGFGKDVISDFQSTSVDRDVVQLDHTVFADFNSLQLHMAQDGTGVVITADANNTIELQNTRLDHLTADDFRFV
jgi:hypothetical protein